MWLRLTNGRIEKILNEDHIRQHKAAGAVEVPDPTTPEEKPVEEKQSEVVVEESPKRKGSKATPASEPEA